MIEAIEIGTLKRRERRAPIGIRSRKIKNRDGIPPPGLHAPKRGVTTADPWFMIFRIRVKPLKSPRDG